MSYRGTHRRTKPLSRRLLVRASGTLAVIAALVSPPLVTGTAHASGNCGTATAPAATLVCVEQVSAIAVDVVKMAQQAAAGVSLPGPIVDQTSLLDLLDQATAQAVQAAEDCLTQTNPICAPLIVRNSLLSLVDQVEAQAIQQAGNCVAQTDPTCALIVQVANQQAQSVETFATTCVSGTNAVCSNLEQLATSEISALVTLANQCVGGTDPTCNSLLGTVSQLLGEAVTCAIGPLGPAAPSTLPNPLVLPGGSAGDGSGLPDPTVTCQQVKNTAAQLLAVCGSVTAPTCGVGVQSIDLVAKSPCLNSTDQVECAQTTAEPPAVPAPDDDPETVFPANELRGTIVLGSGLGAAGVTVSFYVDPGMESTEVVTPDLLGTATTDANGNYVTTITPDTHATTLAADNGGVLNVLISASVSVALPGSVAPPILAIANGETPLTLGGSAVYWESQPPTLLLIPATDVDLSTTAVVDDGVDPSSPTVDPVINYLPAVPSNVPTFAGVPTGDNLFLVNGIDYRDAVPVDAPAAASSGCERPYLSDETQIGKTIEKNDPIGETHAYFDTKADFDYGSTADSTLETGFSTDFKNWVGGSYSTIRNKSSGVGIDITNAGPYYGHQQLSGFLFKAWKIKYQCYDSDKIYYRYKAGATKCQFDYHEGKDVSQYDGYWPYQKALQDGRAQVLPYSTSTHTVRYYIDNGKAYHYTNAFSIWGFQGGSVSGHSTNVVQGITAGTDQYEHDIWGNNKAVRDGPNIMYSY